MRLLRHVVFILHLVAAGLFGQNPPPAKTPAPQLPLSAPASPVAPATALPPGVTLSEPFYPFPAEAKAKIRDLQYESDQLEIQNAKLQRQIEDRAPDLVLQREKNKARQSELIDGMKTVALDFANQKKIDLSQYELDPTEVRFIKKKKATQ